MKLLKIYPENPNEKAITEVVKVLKSGGLIIYPTDTIYAIGCDMLNKSAIDKLCQVIGKKPETANLSLICSDLSNLSTYTVSFADKIYRLMKAVLPGPYTFILQANNDVPKLFKNKKKTVGIRVPANSIPIEIVKLLGNPIVSASIHSKLEQDEYYTDPEEIYEIFKKQVDIVIDGGFGDTQVSTVLDCSEEEILLIRLGKGEVNLEE